MSSCEPECICCCLPCIAGWACIYFTYTGIASGSKRCFVAINGIFESRSDGDEGSGQPEALSEEDHGHPSHPYRFQDLTYPHDDELEEKIPTQHSPSSRTSRESSREYLEDEDEEHQRATLDLDATASENIQHPEVSTQPAPTPQMIQIPAKAMPPIRSKVDPGYDGSRELNRGLERQSG